MVTFPPIRESPLELSFQIRNKGSFTIPFEARQAHRLALDIEVVSVTRTQYQNFLYNLPQGDYCNVTLWSGSTIRETIKVKYPSQRLLDWVNIEGGVYQSTALSCKSVLTTLRSLGAAMGYPSVAGDNQMPPIWGYPITHVKVVCPEDTQIKLTCQWWPFVSLPEIADVLPDLDEPSEGDSEYPSPSRNPANDPWKENAPPSLPDSNRDERDYSPENYPSTEPTEYQFKVPVSYTGSPSVCSFTGQTDLVTVTVPYLGGTFDKTVIGVDWAITYDGVVVYPNVVGTACGLQLGTPQPV